ncbi:hypothetical protein IJE86_02835 [bacterium]|nr:hypothetical protein [bacterium]
MQHRFEPLPLEKIIAPLSYLTAGLVGFVWLLLGAILKLGLRPFLAYHIYQSIFLSFLFFIISTGLTLLLGILSIIPFIGDIISVLTFFLSTPIIASFSLINLLVGLLMIYAIITSFMGKYTQIPWVSGIIKANLRM